MPRKAGAESIQWTGKNLAEVKRFHKDVAHYPEDPKQAGEVKKGWAGGEMGPFHRDWSQHPDNLHVTTEEGHTIVVALGDTITKDADGKLSVEQTAKQRPQVTPVDARARVMAAEGNDTTKGGGRTR